MWKISPQCVNQQAVLEHLLPDNILNMLNNIHAVYGSLSSVILSCITSDIWEEKC